MVQDAGCRGHVAGCMLQGAGLKVKFMDG